MDIHGWSGRPAYRSRAPHDETSASHMLVNSNAKVHVIAASENWPVKAVKSVLKEG
jgi:hypothetical protein